MKINTINTNNLNRAHFGGKLNVSASFKKINMPTLKIPKNENKTNLLKNVGILGLSGILLLTVSPIILASFLARK